MIEHAGWAPTNATTEVAAGMNRVVLGPRLEETAADWGGTDEEMADVGEEEAIWEGEDIMIAETANTNMTEIGIETRALATYA